MTDIASDPFGDSSPVEKWTCPIQGCEQTAALFEACDAHRPLYPPALLKAAADSFDYALRLVTGEVVYFAECTLYEDWVHLTTPAYEHGPGAEDQAPRLPIPAGRGLDVRREHIVWSADAPFGS